MSTSQGRRDTSPTIQSMGFLPIALDTLTASVTLPFDLFLLANAKVPPVLFREQQLALEPSDFDRLGDRDVTALYIRVSDHTAYRRFLVETVLQNERVPAPRRFQVLQAANKAVFEMAFANRNAQKIVDFATNYAEELAGIVCEESLTASELLDLMAHDYYTYTHATNVGVLSLLIARKIGMGTIDGIIALATGALLHDLGKRRISPALLNQRERLTKLQFEAIQEHPKLGFLEVCGRQDVLWDQLMMIYHHHERWDGRGYPVGLVGDEIHLWTRICSVADAYDSMSSARPYRDALPNRKAWAIMENGSGQQFDPELVRVLKSVVLSC